jgi:hypothetical protein
VSCLLLINKGVSKALKAFLLVFKTSSAKESVNWSFKTFRKVKSDFLAFYSDKIKIVSFWRNYSWLQTLSFGVLFAT